jgi:hypothetical protein
MTLANKLLIWSRSNKRVLGSMNWLFFAMVMSGSAIFKVPIYFMAILVVPNVFVTILLFAEKIENRRNRKMTKSQSGNQEKTD